MISSVNVRRFSRLFDSRISNESLSVYGVRATIEIISRRLRCYRAKFQNSKVPSNFTSTITAIAWFFSSDIRKLKNQCGLYVTKPCGGSSFCQQFQETFERL